MTDLPSNIANIFSEDKESSDIFAELLQVLGEELKCDRIFLYARNPQTKVGKVVSCWRRTPEIPDVDDYQWKQEPESLAKEDPLFAAALNTKPSIFIEDVETANPEIVNKEFERKTFGHRALIHAHLCQEGLLWGILQPCIFDKPRSWQESDRQIVAQLETKLTPLVIKYINQTQK